LGKHSEFLANDLRVMADRR